MSTSGVASAARRKARTISSVLLSVCPALSARCDDTWIAGPSAIGSGTVMPSSTPSAPAAGTARSSASDASRSGSPAVRNVTSAARPCDLSSSKRRSMRVVMTRDDFSACSIGQAFALALAHRGHAHIDGAQHQRHDRADELHPFLVLQNGAGGEQPDPQEIRDVGGGHGDQNPTDDLLPADHRPLPPSLILFAVPDKPPRSPNPCRRVRTS